MMKKLFALVYVALALVFGSGFCSCSSGEEVEEYIPVDWECVFLFDGKQYEPGATIYLTEFDEYKIAWKDVNPNNNGHPMLKPKIGGMVEPSIILNNSITFQCVNIGSTVCSVYDNETGQEFKLNLVIEKMGLDDLKKNIRLEERDYNNSYWNGAHCICVETKKNLGVSGRMEIESFGVNELVFYPSEKDDKWGTWKSSYINWTESNYFDKYYGVTSKADKGNVAYIFCKFKYRGDKHEIRYYYKTKEFLWDGEWDK